MTLLKDCEKSFLKLLEKAFFLNTALLIKKKNQNKNYKKTDYAMVLSYCSWLKSGKFHSTMRVLVQISKIIEQPESLVSKLPQILYLCRMLFKLLPERLGRLKLSLFFFFFLNSNLDLFSCLCLEILRSFSKSPLSTAYAICRTRCWQWLHVAYFLSTPGIQTISQRWLGTCQYMLGLLPRSINPRRKREK